MFLVLDKQFFFILCNLYNSLTTDKHICIYYHRQDLIMSHNRNMEAYSRRSLKHTHKCSVMGDMLSIKCARNIYHIFQDLSVSQKCPEKNITRRLNFQEIRLFLISCKATHGLCALAILNLTVTN